MSTPHWHGRFSLWDVLFVEGVQLPGRVTECTVSPSRAVQAVRAKGQDAPALKDEGYEGAPVSIAIEVWAREQFEELTARLSELSPKRPGAASQPINVSHPNLHAFGVSQIFVKGFSAGLPSAGRWTVRITAAQWFPPEAAKPTQQGGANPAQGNAGGGDGGPLEDFNVPDPDPENLGADFP